MMKLGNVMKCFKLSASYARNLRSVGKLVEAYPKFRKLAISARDFVKMKKQITKMLEVDEYREFWKGKTSCESSAQSQK